MARRVDDLAAEDGTHQVNHRSYPVYTAFAVLVIGGMALTLAGIAADVTPVAVVGMRSMLAGVVFVVPLWTAVNATNRPASLDPESHESLFVAVCADDDCDWMSDPVGADEAHPNPEAIVRAQRQHTRPPSKSRGDLEGDLPLPGSPRPWFMGWRLT